MSDFDQLCKSIIRPFRYQYNLFDLDFRRNDFSILNKKGENLMCSHFEILDTSTPNVEKIKKTPCVVYLHCNTGSRVESLPLLEFLISKQISLFSFDFSGSGLSEGQYISLGYNERNDLECIVNYLKTNKNVTNIGLYGRSMGAVTAILYLSQHYAIENFVKGIVIDSAFSDLNTLAAEIVSNKTLIPKLLVKGGLAIFKKTIEKALKFKFEDVSLKEKIKKCFMPSVFIASKEDNFVGYHHTEYLFENYKGNKRILEVFGDHNSSRKHSVLNSICEFFKENLEFIKEEEIILKPIENKKKYEKNENNNTRLHKAKTLTNIPLNNQKTQQPLTKIVYLRQNSNKVIEKKPNIEIAPRLNLLNPKKQIYSFKENVNLFAYNKNN